MVQITLTFAYLSSFYVYSYSDIKKKITGSPAVFQNFNIILLITSGRIETGTVNFFLRNSIQLLLLNMKLHGFACLIHKEVCAQRDVGFFSAACLLRPVKWCNIVVLLDNNNRNRISLVRISNNLIMSSFTEAFYFRKHYWNNIEMNNFSYIPVPVLALWILIIICALRNYYIKNIAFTWSIKSTVKYSLTRAHCSPFYTVRSSHFIFLTDILYLHCWNPFLPWQKMYNLWNRLCNLGLLFYLCIFMSTLNIC